MSLDPGTSSNLARRSPPKGRSPCFECAFPPRSGCSRSLVPCTALSADESSPEALLKSKGLRRQGTTYVLPGEAEFSRMLGTARALYKGFTSAVMQEESLARQLEANKGMIQQLTQQHIFLNRQLQQATTAQENNRLVGMINEISDRINLLNDAADDSGTTRRSAPGVQPSRGVHPGAARLACPGGLDREGL